VGVEGPTPLEEDPGFAIHLLYGATMRDSPSRQAGRITSVPRVATVPVLARNQDGSWLRVNYIGYVGWIITFTGRDLPDVMAVPEAPGLPPLEAIEVVIIPPEVQRAQVQRLRDFVVPRRDLAESLTYFWLAVYRGEVMPCDPPASVVEYQYSRADVRELPELDRYAPQLHSAVEYLNERLRHCKIAVLFRSKTSGRRAQPRSTPGFSSTRRWMRSIASKRLSSSPHPKSNTV
jgi:hypothetical protein